MEDAAAVVLVGKILVSNIRKIAARYFNAPRNALLDTVINIYFIYGFFLSLHQANSVLG
jgi:hypothetical protein